MNLKEETLLGDQVHRHRYYRAKLAALLQAVGDLPPFTVLDVGAGSGFFSHALLGTGRMVLLMDVLEHVEDDAGLVRHYAERVLFGARFVVTVPAFPWLWSGHDVFLEHHRRYTLPGLEAVLRSASLWIEFGSYYYGAVLPVAALARLGQRLLGDRGREPKSDMRRFGPLLNGLFWGACRAELPFLGVASPFAQNCTLSRKGQEVRGLHKRRFTDGLSLLCQIWRFPLQNPLSEPGRKVSRSCMSLTVQF